jgi:hypothetical protein
VSGELPTLAEQDLKDVEAMLSFGLLAAAGPPREIIVHYNDAINEIVRESHLIEPAAKQGIEIRGGTPEQLRELFARDIAIGHTASAPGTCLCSLPCVNLEAPKLTPCVERIAGTLGVPSYSDHGEGLCRRRCLELTTSSSPGSQGTAWQEGMCSESLEPLVGRLGAPHSEGIAYKPPCGEIALCLRAGRMGPDK